MKTIQAVCLTLVIFCVAIVSTSRAEKTSLKLWYNEPAQKWTQALPIGNGRLGAMVFGRVEKERIQFNEDSFWSGRPHDYINPQARQYLDKVRSLIFQGKYREAQEIADKNMMGIPRFLQAYQPMGDLFLQFKNSQLIKNYHRELDLENAIVTVSYQAGDVKYKREVFCSAADGVIVVHLSCDKPGQISVQAELTSPHHYTIEKQSDARLVMTGQWIGAGGPDGEDSLIAPVKGKGIKFESHLQVRNEGGDVNLTNEKIVVTKADSATFILTAATSFKNYRDITGNPSDVCRRIISNLSRKSYEQLRDAHIADYRELFTRVKLQLGNSNAVDKPTDKRIESLRNSGSDPGLIALFFHYGRYLLISSSRPGTQPANLQGIWNDRKSPPWGSKYTLNINAECNYWPAEVCNLAECHQPLFDLITDLSVTGSKVAEQHYGCRGWLAHHNTDIWRAATPVDGAFWGMWPTGGAWLVQHLWEHFQFSGDKEFLAKRAYPLMKGAAQFFLDYLVEDPQNGYLVTCPSLSPEIAHHESVSICAAPTMDIQIITDLFNRCIEAGKILNTDKAFRSQLQAALKRLPPMQIGKYGQLQEWLFDVNELEPEHRHVSHIFGLFPGDLISLQGTPELAKAVTVSLQRRGDGGMAWGVAWKAACWARLKNAEHCEKLIQRILATNTNPNLFCEIEPFQIDGNFASTAAIAEMLLQSQNGRIQLLGALPSAWPAGFVKGLRARGGFEVEIYWEKGRMKKTRIYSLKGKTATITYRNKTIELETKPEQTFLLDGDLKLLEL